MERNPNSCHRQLLSTWAPTAAKCDAHCPVFPDCRHVGAIRYPSVHSRCHSEFAWLLSESHVSRPRWELLTHRPLDFDRGPIRFWPRPGLRPSSHHPPPDGLREADKKGNGLRSKEKKKKEKIGSVSNNSWVSLGESQPVFQACCVLTHHCQDCDLWFLGLHPSCCSISWTALELQKNKK